MSESSENCNYHSTKDEISSASSSVSDLMSTQTSTKIKRRGNSKRKKRKGKSKKSKKSKLSKKLSKRKSKKVSKKRKKKSKISSKKTSQVIKVLSKSGKNKQSKKSKKKDTKQEKSICSLIQNSKSTDNKSKKTLNKPQPWPEFVDDSKTKVIVILEPKTSLRKEMTLNFTLPPSSPSPELSLSPKFSPHLYSNSYTSGSNTF